MGKHQRNIQIDLNLKTFNIDGDIPDFIISFKGGFVIDKFTIDRHEMLNFDSDTDTEFSYVEGRDEFIVRAKRHGGKLKFNKNSTEESKITIYDFNEVYLSTKELSAFTDDQFEFQGVKKLYINYSDDEELSQIKQAIEQNNNFYNDNTETIYQKQ